MNGRNNAFNIWNLEIRCQKSEVENELTTKCQMLNAKFQTQKGITLIALIITVIILLILAGTAISIAINGGDIFNKAAQARTKWNEQVNEENTVLNYYIEYLDNIGKEPLTDVFVTVCANGTLVFSNNETDINTYLTENSTSIKSGYEILNVKETVYHYNKNNETWAGDSPAWKSDYSITQALFLNKVVPKCTAGWFFDLLGLTSIGGIQYLNTSNVTDMSHMFYNCTSLQSVNLSNFNTSKVTDMSYMFGGFNDEYIMTLTSLDLSSFDTSKVTNMEGMFYWDNYLTSLNLSSFNTSKVTNMKYMFAGVYITSDLDLSSFNTSNVTDMSDMFNSTVCYGNVNLSSFNTSNVTDMSGMFSHSGIKTSQNLLDLSNFNTTNVTNMRAMFFDSGIKCIDLSSFNTSNVTDMMSMFSKCTYLETIYASDNFVTTNVTESSLMFNQCSSLRSNVGNWGVDNNTNATNTNKTYAKIGTATVKGYFSEKTN